MKIEELTLDFDSREQAHARGPVELVEQCRREGRVLHAPPTILEREGRGVLVASVSPAGTVARPEVTTAPTAPDSTEPDAGPAVEPAHDSDAPRVAPED